MSSCSHTTALAIPSFSASKAAFGRMLCLSLSAHDGVDIPSKSEMMPKSLGSACLREDNVGGVRQASWLCMSWQAFTPVGVAVGVRLP